MKLQFEYKITDDNGEEKIRSKTITGIEEETQTDDLAQFSKAYQSLLNVSEFKAYLILKNEIE